jgi:hypothetical protein
MKGIYLFTSICFILLFGLLCALKARMYSPSKKMIEIDVICLARDNGEYVEYLKQLVTKIRKANPSYKLKFYFFENNSKDDTVQQIDEFLMIHEGVRISYDLNNKPFAKFEKSNERMVYMSNLRRLFKQELGVLSSKYVITLDTDTQFSNDTFARMIKTLESDESIGMVTPYLLDSGTQGHYFDTLALRINGKTQWPNCPFANCSSCGHEYGHIEPRGIIQVDSAFGGLCLMYTDIYNKCNYTASDGDQTEHDSFNDEYIRKSGKKIVIDTDIRPVMMV